MTSTSRTRARPVDLLAAAAGAEEDRDRRGIVLAGLVKLKQVCNHPALFLHDGSALPGRSGKLARLEELLDEIVAAGDRVLCFTQFAEWGSLLVPPSGGRSVREPLWLHGGMRRAARGAGRPPSARRTGRRSSCSRCGPAAPA